MPARPVVDRLAPQSHNMRMRLQTVEALGWTQIASAEAPPPLPLLEAASLWLIMEPLGKALVGQDTCHALRYVTVKPYLLSSYAKHAVHPTGSRVSFEAESS